jgi:hypothetical protein
MPGGVREDGLRFLGINAAYPSNSNWAVAEVQFPVPEAPGIPIEGLDTDWAIRDPLSIEPFGLPGDDGRQVEVRGIHFINAGRENYKVSVEVMPGEAFVAGGWKVVVHWLSRVVVGLVGKGRL